MAAGRVPQAGQAIEPEARGRAHQGNRNICCLAVQTFESEARGEVPPFFGLGNREVSFALAALRLSLPHQNLPSNHPSTTRSFTSQLTGQKSVSVSLPSKFKPNKVILNPRNPVFLVAFNVRTLGQMGQPATLAETLLSLKIDVCCVFETLLSFV